MEEAFCRNCKSLTKINPCNGLEKDYGICPITGAEYIIPHRKESDSVVLIRKDFGCKFFEAKKND